MTRRGEVERDQDRTTFSTILGRFCQLAALRGAAFVDQEGETVDYAGFESPFDIKVAAAEWRLVLRGVVESGVAPWQSTRLVIARADTRSYFVAALADGYALVAVAPRRSFGISPRALLATARDLSAESGLPFSERAHDRWQPVLVREHRATRRPRELSWGGTWQPVEVLGRYASAPLTRGERGYRARLENGAEITLVRERLARWYGDELPTLIPATA